MKAKFAAPDVRNAVDPSDLDREVTHYAIPHLEEFGVPIVQHSSEIESGKLLVRQDDVLISKLNPRKSRVFKVGDHDVRPVIASGEFIVFRPRLCHPDFLAYLLQSDTVTRLLTASAKSVTRSHQRVDPATVRNIELPAVSLKRQRRIAKFLDRETAQIDKLIAKQEQLISTLAERFAAETYAAVVPGVDHTDGIQLRHVAVVLDCKHVTAEFVEEGHPLASIGEIGGEIVDLSRAKRTTREFYDLLRDGGRAPRLGDLIFTRNATVGNVSRVVVDLEPFALGQDVCLIRADAARVNPEFLQAQLKGPSIRTQLDRLLIGSTFKRVNIEQIRGLRVFIPDLDSQKVAVDRINNSRSRTNSLISRSQSAIDLLKERRQALISAAVTGQIDV